MLHHIAFLTTILTLISADHSVTIKNSCSFDLYPGVAGSTNTSNNGFLLTSGSTQIVTYPLDSNGLWSGRVWPRTGCVPTEGDPNGLVCETGDCGNKLQCSTYGAGGVTLAEVTHQTAQDWYDISLVDGYSVPMSYGPQDGTGACKQIACSVPPKDFTCPTELQKKNAAGELIECLSACTALGNAEYCCTGAHNVPDTCPASTYSLGFKKQCPDAYSYAYDDLTSTFTCSGSTKYSVEFCPSTSGTTSGTSSSTPAATSSGSVAASAPVVASGNTASVPQSAAASGTSSTTSSTSSAVPKKCKVRTA